MIKIRDLEYLDAIAKYRHFSKAAEACCVSQPTLSGQIMKLEEQLNLQLIERHRRNVMLTPSGEELVKLARRVLMAANDFEESAKALLDPMAGDLHVGLIPTIAPYLLPHIMENLNKQLPKINFYLHENKTNTLLNDLNQGKLDFIILPWLENMTAFDRYHLFNEPLILALYPGHPLSKKPNVKLEDLNGQLLLTLEDGHCLRDQTLGYCFSAGADEDHQFNATSLETLRYMVSSKRGITMLPELSTINTPANQSIKYISFQDPKPYREISLLIRPNYARTECIRSVVNSIKDSIKGVLPS